MKLNKDRLDACCYFLLTITGIFALLGLITGAVMIGIYYGRPQIVDPTVKLAGIVLMSVCGAYEIFLITYMCCVSLC